VVPEGGEVSTFKVYVLVCFVNDIFCIDGVLSEDPHGPEKVEYPIQPDETTRLAPSYIVNRLGTSIASQVNWIVEPWATCDKLIVSLG
jgi:hypothetical protein